MLPVDEEKIARDLATLGDRGRAAAEAGLRRWSAEHPTKPCVHCFGKGSFVERAGERRPFDYRDFSAEAGDRYEGTCPACRGLGRVFVTPEEAARLVSDALRAQREAYRAVRTAVCAEQGIEPVHFDRIVAKRVPASDRSPSTWLAAARDVAVFFGVEVDSSV